MLSWRSRLGVINRRLQHAMLYSPHVPGMITRAFGRVHGRVMCAFYGMRSRHTVLEPRHYLARLLQPGDVYVDIGASFGLTTSIAVVSVGRQGAIYAFEPQTRVFQQLMQMKSRFGWDTVTPVQSLVGEETGECILYEHPGNSQISSTSPSWNMDSGKAVSYPITTLDDWMARHDLKQIDLMKIDVEGAELHVVRGAKQMLKTNQCTLLIEINNRKRRKALFAYTIDDLLDELRQAGYTHFYSLREEGLTRFENEADLVEADLDMVAHVGSLALPHRRLVIQEEVG